jgi:hypothetical protein
MRISHHHELDRKETQIRNLSESAHINEEPGYSEAEM